LFTYSRRVNYFCARLSGHFLCARYIHICQFPSTYLAQFRISVTIHDQSYNYRHSRKTYEGWNFNSGNYLFTTDTK